jgi:multidrug efflux system outer membrane protein
MNIVTKLLLATLLLFCINGCKMGPNYSQPPQPEPENYRQIFPSGESIADMPWWEYFGDEVLIDLIDTALYGNRDLRGALARIEESLAIVGIVRADLYPRVNYAADAGIGIKTDGSGVAGTVNGVILADYQVDLWGRIARLNEAALNEYLATEEAYRAIIISIVSGVAESYLLLRDLDNRLDIAFRTVDIWQANLDIIQARFDAGMVSEVDLNQAIIQLAGAQASIQRLTRLRDQTENSLSVLIGIPPTTIPRGLPLYDQFISPEVPVGLPSELLSRRPDLLQAERRLHAQTARIGAAEALKYPQLTITADLGASFATNPVVGFSNLGAQILGPIFNSGAIKKGIEIEMARTTQLLNSYEQTYLIALREVEDALIAVRSFEREYEIRQRQMDAADQAVELSWVRYNNGLTSYLEVLNLQRSQFQSQLEVSESLQNQLASTVNLYKALGGGWQLNNTGD